MIIGTKENLVRFSFCNVFEAKTAIEGSDPKFSVQIMVPKTHVKTVEAIKKAIEDAKAVGIAKNLFTAGATKARDFRTCLRDGDVEAEEGENKAYLKGHYFFNASCNEKNPPQVVDRQAKPIMRLEDFYSGCYGCADINFYPFKFGKGGVAAGLNSVMKREDGERLDGKVDAEKAFEKVMDDDDDITENISADLV